MRKLLKLLFVLSSAITLPLSVIACGQESLDSILNIIYQDKTSYSIDEFLPKQIESFKEKYQLLKQESNELAKSIFQTILTKAENQTKISWDDDENLVIGEKAYSFKITNGEKTENNEGIIWNVKKTTGTISIKISYLVGTINSDKKLDAKQKIDMTFEIKCYQSESDSIINKWVDKFNKQIVEQKWNSTNPLTINLTDKAIDLPKIGVNWLDLTEKVQQETNKVMAEQIKDTSVSWIIQNNNDKTITSDHQLAIYLFVSKNNTKKATNVFNIRFK